MPSLRSRILHRTLQRVTSALDARLSVQEQRTRLDEMARRGIRLPKGMTVRTIQAGGVHAEWIEPAVASPQTVILYLHGGGYCLFTGYSPRAGRPSCPGRRLASALA